MNQVPLIGRQQEQAKQEIMATMTQLSLGIYSHLATAYIGTIDTHQSLDEGHLRSLARHSQVAATAYFEGIGVIKR